MSNFEFLAAGFKPLFDPARAHHSTAGYVESAHQPGSGGRVLTNPTGIFRAQYKGHPANSLEGLRII